MRLNVQASGTEPLSYQWLKGTTVLENTGNVSGANTGNLSVSSLSASDSDSYTCVITNDYGSVTSAVVNLSVVALPEDAKTLNVLSNSPVGYWQLDESSGDTVAG
ncbi:MAG: immunoglobulin domain-containing protein [Limisphaerales bacterium]